MIVLGCVAVLSAILIAFLVAQQNERASSFSYSQSVKADELAMGGVDLVLQNLLQEIRDTNRSVVASASGGPSLYVPQSNAFAIPERMPSAAVAPSSTNLLKISSSSVPFYTNGPVLAAASSSSAPSANGRSMDRSRWNRPHLIDAASVADTIVPEWILVTRTGRTNAWSDASRDPKSDQAVIGRIAFAVYDIGGLLDVNVAGYPSALSGLAEIRQKGTLPWSDLAEIPSVSQGDAVLEWRNPATTTPPTVYPGYVQGFGGTNGFLKVNSGDRTFLSRQDLIQYAKANPGIIGTNALPYLTTFTREINAPVFSPVTPAGSSVDYALLAQDAAATNASLATARRSDGQLLLKKRFPLSRMALLANPSAHAAEIEKHFGLRLNPDGYSFTYLEAPIKTLQAVAAAGREPNFFELLQAVILRGSFGLSSHAGSQPLFAGAYFDASIMRQVLATGVNLIDQYDADSLPTVVHLPGDSTGTPSAGIESIPYINEMFLTAYRPTVAEGGPASREKLVARLNFELWNPHQNATAVSAGGPANFRIVAREGALRLMAYDPPYFTAPSLTSSPSLDFGAAYSNATIHQIQFSNQAAFAEPTVLTTANSVNSDPNGVIGTSSGLHLGSLNLPDRRLSGSTSPYEYYVLQLQGQGLNALGQYAVTLEAQFQDPLGNWQTYQKFPNAFSVTPSNTPSVGGSPWTSLNLASPQMSLSRVDPRGSRWTLSRITSASPPYPDAGTPGATIRPGAAFGLVAGENGLGGPNTVAPFSFWPAGTRGWGNSSYIGMVCDNDPASAATSASTRVAGYADLDGVVRRADGDTAHDVLPMASGRFLDRPLVLNRPFRSVAEMGYAFRDLPWKSLDFRRGNTADAGLLDVFTASEVGETPGGLVAGKVCLNGRRPEVFAAILTGAGIRERDGSATMLPEVARQLASELTAVTASTPFLNKADLVRIFAAQKETVVDGNHPARKTEREGMVRALAEVGQTRTWNLLIDVVAQAGKYPLSATGPDTFHVEGERRYWLQVAIDRYTGEVVDSQLEPVYE